MRKVLALLIPVLLCAFASAQQVKGPIQRGVIPKTVAAGGGGAGIVQSGIPTCGQAVAPDTVLNFSHTTLAGSNRCLLVYVATDSGGVTAISYNGDAMTEVTSSIAMGGLFLYRLVAPDEGSNLTVSVTLSGPPAHYVYGAVSYTGVDQTTPFGTPATPTTANSSTPSITVTSASGELVINAVGFVSLNPAPTMTPGTGTAELCETAIVDAIGGALGSEPGASSATVDWSKSDSEGWASLAVSMRPAA